MEHHHYLMLTPEYNVRTILLMQYFSHHMALGYNDNMLAR